MTTANPTTLQNKPAPSPSHLRIGKRYRATRVDEHYDAIIIGSGPGGLVNAACLAKMGWKVAVLEQHYTAGGFTHAYGRNGYEWDVGVHYIGDMGRDNSAGRRLFDFVTDSQLKWSDMGTPYDTVFLGDDVFEFPKGEKELIKALVARFPEEEAGIGEYFQLLRRVSHAMRPFAMSKVLPDILSKPLAWWQKKSLPPEMFQPTQVVLDKLIKSKKLKAILTTQWGDSGLTPKESSFIIHANIARHYLNGGYYPVGGASKIAETHLPVIQKAGGEVFTYARVESIVIEQNRATGVKMADGHIIKSNTVISGVGVPLTFEKLLPETVAKQLGYEQKSKNIQPSMAHFSVYLGLNKTAQELKLPKTNFWIYLDEHHDENVQVFLDDPKKDIPLVYISFPSAKDPSWDERYPGKATIEIVAPAAYEWFEKWKDETWGNRGDDYDAIKQAWLDRLLKVLYKKLPQVEQHIDYCELATPLSTQFFCEYSKGEIYGLDHTPKRFEQRWLKPQTAIKGFYLTGQDILTCGVVGAAMGGMITAVSVLGLRKGKQLQKLMMSS